MCQLFECTNTRFTVLFIHRLSELEYEKLADETLDSLTELFEDLPDRLSSCDSEYDVTLGVRSLFY